MPNTQPAHGDTDEFTETDAANALRVLAEAAVDRENKLDEYNDVPDCPDLEEENDSECPNF